MKIYLKSGVLRLLWGVWVSSLGCTFYPSPISQYWEIEKVEYKSGSDVIRVFFDTNSYSTIHNWYYCWFNDYSARTVEFSRFLFINGITISEYKVDSQNYDLYSYDSLCFQLSASLDPVLHTTVYIDTHLPFYEKRQTALPFVSSFFRCCFTTESVPITYLALENN